MDLFLDRKLNFYDKKNNKITVFIKLTQGGFEIKPEDEIFKKRLDQEIRYAEVLAEYCNRWGKPLLMTSSVARLAVRRNYVGLVNLLEKGIMLYPTIEDVIKAYSMLVDRNYFLEKEGVTNG